MQYKRVPLADKGYSMVDGNVSLEGVSGLKNKVIIEDEFEDDQRFYHRGYEGFPDTSDCTVHMMIMRTEAPFSGLYIFEGNIPGGTEIAEADVLAALIAEFGFPAGTTLGADGLPVVPEE
jgi:hypothetical protein